MPILIAAVSAYSIFLLLWYKAVLPGKPNQWVFVCVSVVLCAAAFVLSVEFNLYRTGIFIIFGAAVLAFRLIFYTSNLQAFYFSTFYILSVYSSRGIIAAVFSLIQKQKIDTVLSHPASYNLIWVLAVLLSISIMALKQQIISTHSRIKQLFNYPDQVKFVATTRAILIIYIMLIDDGRYQDLPFIWFSTMYLLSCIMIKTLMLFVENQAIKVTALFEYELNTRQLEQQLVRQMRHYQAYKKYTKNFGAFQHDFKNMMAAVKTLISSNEDEKAISLIDEIHNDLNKCSIIKSTYSDNIIVDAILQDTFDQCEEKQIRFVAMVHLPGIQPVSDLDLVRLFTNIIDNAVEACCKVPVSERFIQMNGTCTEGWISVEITNSYDGLASCNVEGLITSKPNKRAHGFGMNIVKEIVENNGGLIFTETNQEEKKFLLRFHIPRHVMD